MTIPPVSHPKKSFTQTCFNWFLILMLASAISCNQKTTQELIPDNCQGVVQIDLPHLLPRLLANRPVLDSLIQLIGFPLESMGINFFEPAWIFQENEDTPILLLGKLSNASAFEKELVKKFPQQKLVKQGNFSSFWTGHQNFIWSEDFFFVQSTNPVLGQPDWDPQVEIWFEKKEKSKPYFSETADLQFFWNINQELLGGIIPTLETKLEGKANWSHPDLELKVEIEEHQYLALLKPFFETENAQSGIAKLVIWPAIESILLQLDSYGGNAYKNEMNSQIMKLLSRMDQPFICRLDATQTHNLLHHIQIKTRFSDLETGHQLHEEIRKMLPGSILKDYAISEKAGEQVFHHQTSKPGFDTLDFAHKKDGPRNQLFHFSYRHPELETRIGLTLNEPGHYTLLAKIRHPEKVRGQTAIWELLTLDPETILSHFMPETDEPIP